MGTSNDETKKHQAATLLASSLSQQNMQRVINCATAKEIWLALEATFENKSSTERTMLMEKFTSYKIRSVKDISQSIGEIQSLAAKLRSLGATIDDEFIISIILKGLPEVLKPWKSTWKMVNAKEPNLNNLITGVMAEVNEMRTPESSALVMRDRPWEREPGGVTTRRIPESGMKNPRRGNTGRGPRQDKSSTCHYCNKPGHWIRDCRKKQADEKGPTGPQRGLAMMAKTKQLTLLLSTWIADSGCSFHMTPRSEWICNYTPFEEAKQIALGDNHCIPAVGMGAIKTSFGELKEVHLVPELSANLSSTCSRCNRE